MIAPGILGQEQALRLLERALASGRMPHALLLQGPTGVGKGTVARALAKTLLCTERAEDAPEPACGRCRACHMVEHGNHPDFVIVERLPRKKSAGGAAADDDESDDDALDEGAEGGGPRAKAELRSFIVVDQIRMLSDRAQIAPREGRRRVFVIDPADRMNAEAQNALLKTLEEPPGRAVLVLVAARSHALLPTVRSRCLLVRFGSMPVETLAEDLVARGIGRTEALGRAALSGGRPGLALTLDLDELAARRDETLRILETLVRGPKGVAELPAMAKAVAGDDAEDLAAALDLLEALLRDAALAASGARGVVHADVAARLTALGEHLGPGRAARLVRAVDRLRDDLRLNLSRTLVAEAVLAAVAGGPIPR